MQDAASGFPGRAIFNRSGVRLVPSPQAIRFHVYRDEQHLHTQTLSELIIKIGRMSTSHLRLEDEAASRLHAMVEVSTPDEIYIRDLGSSSGTFVNGVRSEKARLHDGDEIRIGTTRLVVEFVGGQAPGASRIEPVRTTASAVDAAATVPPAWSSFPGGATRLARDLRVTHRRWAVAIAVLFALVALVSVVALRS